MSFNVKAVAKAVEVFVCDSRQYPDRLAWRPHGAIDEGNTGARPKSTFVPGASMAFFEGSRVDAAEPAGIVTDCIESGTSSLLLDSPALPREFYDLRTRVLGTIVQRATQYRIRLAVVVPDVDTRSDPFQAFVREANRGEQLFFARSRGEAIRWLESGDR